MIKLKYVIFFSLFFGSKQLFSQPPKSASREATSVFAASEAEEIPPNPYEVPLDGGASLLAAAGVAYGAKKIYDLRKKKDKKDED